MGGQGIGCVWRQSEEAGLISITFSRRTHEQYLQMHGEVALHAEVLCELFPGGRASLLQQVKERRDFFFVVGNAIQAAQGHPWEEAPGGHEQPVGTVTEELH